MKEYIEREAALKAVGKAFVWGKSQKEQYDGSIHQIERIPAADVVPVRHGKWTITVDEWLHHCSICGQRRPIVAGDYKWNYCPNCGARMDGDGDV